MLSRRQAILGAAALASAPSFAKDLDPFPLGVASGYPTPTGMVLWTRLAPVPRLPDGGMGAAPVLVEVEVAEDPGFRTLVYRGVEPAEAELGHSVHHEVDGLAADRWYHYRFRALGATSPVGRTRTAPRVDAPTAGLKLALASCQHYEHGLYLAWRDAAAWAPDLVVFVGDYIYERRWGQGLVRSVGSVAEPHTLGDYRRLYALYREDPHLRAAHASAPWLVTWDDHEVENDYAGLQSENLDDPERFRARRQAAYQAWYEHMPVPREMLPAQGSARIHARRTFGDLATFHVLDSRQHRTPQPCGRWGEGGSTVTPGCAGLEDPAQSMLGAVQEAWLKSGLRQSKTQWNILAQQTLVASFDGQPGPGEQWWTDGWSAYPRARARLVDALASSGAKNPVLLGGDLHQSVVANVHRDPRIGASPIVAAELVCTSITSFAPFTPEQEAARRAENPHVLHYDGQRRGYTRLALTPGRAVAEHRVLDRVDQESGVASTASTWVIEAGRPGVQRG